MSVNQAPRLCGRESPEHDLVELIISWRRIHHIDSASPRWLWGQALPTAFYISSGETEVWRQNYLAQGDTGTAHQRKSGSLTRFDPWVETAGAGGAASRSGILSPAAFPPTAAAVGPLRAATPVQPRAEVPTPGVCKAGAVTGGGALAPRSPGSQHVRPRALGPPGPYRPPPAADQAR